MVAERGPNFQWIERPVYSARYGTGNQSPEARKNRRDCLFCDPDQPRSGAGARNGAREIFSHLLDGCLFCRISHSQFAARSLRRRRAERRIHPDAHGLFREPRQEGRLVTREQCAECAHDRTQHSHPRHVAWRKIPGLFPRFRIRKNSGKDGAHDPSHPDSFAIPAGNCSGCRGHGNFEYSKPLFHPCPFTSMVQFAEHSFRNFPGSVHAEIRATTDYGNGNRQPAWRRCTVVFPDPGALWDGLPLPAGARLEPSGPEENYGIDVTGGIRTRCYTNQYPDR